METLKIYCGKNKHDAYEYILWKMEGGEKVLLVSVFKKDINKGIKKKMYKTVLNKM